MRHDMFFFFKQKTAYDLRISDWSSDVCSSDLGGVEVGELFAADDLHRNRHVLQILLALLRGDDDFVDVAVIGLRCSDGRRVGGGGLRQDRKSTRLNSSH